MPRPTFSQSDAELFAEVAQGKAQQARSAKRELYERHAGYLHATFQGKTHRLLSHCSWTPDDLVQETFARAFERAASYHAEGETSSEHERRRTRAWLGRIAERLLADSLRRSREVLGAPGFEEIADPGPPSSDSRATHLIREALLTLSERERDILRVSALYLRVGEEHQRLPNDVASELGNRWGISSDNLRAIRRRALQKVRLFLENSFTRTEAHHGG